MICSKSGRGSKEGGDACIERGLPAEKRGKGGRPGSTRWEKPPGDPGADGLRDHGDVPAHEVVVELLGERREEDLRVAAQDGEEEGVVAVEFDARLPEPPQPVGRRSRSGQRGPTRGQPGLVHAPHDLLEYLFLALEVAVDGAGGEAGVARDLGDAGAPIAEALE